jgi:mitochondrial fission protein ELM1
MQIVVIEDQNIGHNKPLTALINELSKHQNLDIINFKLNDEVDKILMNNVLVSSSVLIIGAGHQSHKKIRALKKFLSKKTKVISVALMKPSFCLKQYDVVITPKHDFISSKIPRNVIAHEGSLAEVSQALPQENSVVIALGGPTPKMKFDNKLIIRNVQHILNVFPSSKIHLCNSRRTPEGLWDEIKSLSHQNIEIHEAYNTDRDSFQRIIALSENKFVTPDSINLISECLSSKGRTHAIQTTQLTPKKSFFKSRANKISYFIDSMESKGYLGFIREIEEGPIKVIRIKKPSLSNDPLFEVEKVAYELNKRLKNF